MGCLGARSGRRCRCWPVWVWFRPCTAKVGSSTLPRPPTVVRVTEMGDGSPVWAREIARRVLADALPDRWAHTQGVAGQARAVGPVLGWDTDLIEAAGWLHDIGYAPALAATGFHPLDGARY